MDIQSIPLFRGMNEKNIDLNGVNKHYAKGERLLKEGDQLEKIGIVLSGRVILSCRDIWGTVSILGSAEAGSVFGEAYACLSDEPLLIDATAAEETDVLFLHIQQLLSDPQLTRNLLSICAHRSLELSRRILHTTPKTIRGRLLSYFSQCAKLAGKCTFDVPFNRQQLADYLGVDRSALCSELSKMRHDGLLSFEKNRFTVRTGIDSDL